MSSILVSSIHQWIDNIKLDIMEDLLVFVSQVFDKSLQFTFSTVDEVWLSDHITFTFIILCLTHSFLFALMHNMQFDYFKLLFQYFNLFLTRIDGLRRRISSSREVDGVLDYSLIRETFQVCYFYKVKCEKYNDLG